MGIVIGSFGGLMWDVVCNEVLLVFKKGEFYVLVVFFGGIVVLVVLMLEVFELVVLLVCVVVIFVFRVGSLLFGWLLFGYCYELFKI